MKLFTNKKFIITAASIFLVAGIAFTATQIVSASSLEKAKKTAEEYISEGSDFIGAETGSDSYEIKYYNAEKKEKYEIEINRKNGKVIEIKTQSDETKGSNTVTLTEANVKDIVLKEYPEAEIQSVELKEDDGLKRYSISFSAKEYKGSFIVNPENGNIIERKIKYGTPIVIPIDPMTTGGAQGDGTAYLSLDKVREIANSHVQDGIITDIDFEKEKSGYVYEIEIYKDGYEYDLVIDAVSGNQITMKSHKESWDSDDYDISWDYNTGSGNNQNINYKSSDEIKNILLDKVAGATIAEMEFELDDGRAKYEGKLYKDNTKYEFEIDAVTGEILKWSTKTVTATETQKPNNTSKPSATNKPSDTEIISMDKAKEIALNKVPGAEVVKLKLERDDGRQIYDGELVKDGMEYEFEIDAYTGTVLEWKTEKIDDDRPINGSSDYIGIDKAKEIVLAKLQGGTIIEIELDEDDDRLTYEGEATKDTVEYEFKIDAYTGAIIEWEID